MEIFLTCFFFFFNLNVPCDFHSSDEQASSLEEEYMEWITDTGDENEPIRNRLPVF